MTPRAGSKARSKPGLRFHHVLVPTDLTERTAKALQLAKRLAGHVTLLHVIETIDGVEFDELKPFYTQLER